MHTTLFTVYIYIFEWRDQGIYVATIERVAIKRGSTVYITPQQFNILFLIHRKCEKSMHAGGIIYKYNIWLKPRHMILGAGSYIAQARSCMSGS